MKKLLGAVLALGVLAFGSQAFGFAIGDANTDNFQDNGFVFINGPGESGASGIEGSWEVQSTDGFGVATGGDDFSIAPSVNFQSNSYGIQTGAGEDDAVTIQSDQLQVTNFDASTQGSGSFTFDVIQGQADGVAGAHDEQGTSLIAGSGAIAGVEGTSSEISGDVDVDAYQIQEETFSITNNGGDNFSQINGYSVTTTEVNLDGNDYDAALVGQAQGGAAYNNDQATNQHSDASAGAFAVDVSGGDAAGYQALQVINVDTAPGKFQYQEINISTTVD